MLSMSYDRGNEHDTPSGHLTPTNLLLPWMCVLHLTLSLTIPNKHIPGMRSKKVGPSQLGATVWSDWEKSSLGCPQLPDGSSGQVPGDVGGGTCTNF